MINFKSIIPYFNSIGGDANYGGGFDRLSLTSAS
jgi:hypothetical protein